MTEVQEKLQIIMAREFNAIYEIMIDKKIDMRTAAYVHALTRIGSAIESQGTRQYFLGE